MARRRSTGSSDGAIFAALAPALAAPASALAAVTLAAVMLAAVMLAGCGPASGGDPEFWAPVGREGGGGGATGTLDGAGGGGSGAEAGSGSGDGGPSMSFTFTTVSFNGEYAPKNVGAVWVEDAGGAFVKTLEVWGAKRIKYVEKWKAASGGNTVDAVTGATRSSHGQHQVGWDLRGLDGQAVPDGLYHVTIEFTEKNGPGAWTVADMKKGAAAFEGTPGDTPYFIGQHLTFQPGK